MRLSHMWPEALGPGAVGSRFLVAISVGKWSARDVPNFLHVQDNDLLYLLRTRVLPAIRLRMSVPNGPRLIGERFSHTHQASDFRVGFVDLPVTYRFFTFNHLCHLPDNHRLSLPTYEPWSAHEPRLQNHFTPNNTPPANSLTFSTSSQATPSKSSPWTGRKPLAGLRTRHASLPSFDPNDRHDASAIYRQNRAVRCPRCRPSPPLLRHQSHSLPPDRLLAAGSAAGAPASWLLRHMKATSTRRPQPTCES